MLKPAGFQSTAETDTRLAELEQEKKQLLALREQLQQPQSNTDALINQNRSVPNRKNRVDPDIEGAVKAYAVEQPAHGQVRVSNELRKRGVFVSASGVRSVWLRH